MRAPRLLPALIILAAAFALSATPAMAAAPDVDVTSATSPAPGQLEMHGAVDPHGLAWSYQFTYFKRELTTNCNTPAPEDFVTSVSTSLESMPASNEAVPVSSLVTGLPYESDYCYRLAASNDDGDNATLFWGIDDYISAPAPVVENQQFDNGSDSISYTADLTPNATAYDTNVVAEYFAKTETACADYDGAISEVWNYNPDGGWNGWHGYSPQAVSGGVEGLAPNTTYCIRIRANSRWGYSDNTSWSEVTTVQPTAASVTNVRLVANSNPGIDAALKFDLDDFGAGEDVHAPSLYSINVWDVGAGRCNDQDYFGGPLVASDTDIDFAGQQSVAFDMDGLDLGKPYCATISVDSAWGDSYDSTVHVEVFYGSDPTLSGQVLATIDHTRIGGYMSVNPGHLAADYGVEYFPKTVDCASDAVTPRTSLKTDSIGTNLGSTVLKTFTVSGLTPDTTYCVRGWIETSWGRATGAFADVTTAEQPPQAEISGVYAKPTTADGMSATFSWNADDMGAYAATFNQSFVNLKLWAAPETCDPDGIDGVTPAFEGNQYFSGEATVDIDVPDLTPGNTYCLLAHLHSAWIGSDTIRWDEIVLPGKPEVTNTGTSQPSSSSLKIDGTLGATWLDTDYELQWHELTPGDECDDAASTITGSSTTTGSENASAKQLSNTITGLAVGDVICWRYRVDNRFGEYWNDWSETLIADVDAPAKPTGLVFTNVTQTSATLSWNSSDNVGVDYYVLKDPVIGIANPTTSSTTVSLTCGESKSFKVIAVDAAGNSSEASDVATVTAAACPVTQPPGEQPPAKQCFNKYSKKVSGKSAKGKKFSATISGRPSADGQSIEFSFKASGKGASKAKAGFASSRTGKTGKAAKRTDDTPLYFRYANGKKFKALLVPVTRSVC